MSGLTKSKGNMYDWVSHTHTHLSGACEHACSYCYVKAMSKRFPVMMEKYGGEIRIEPGSLEVNYGEGKTIFIDHLNDLFGLGVPDGFIKAVAGHCMRYSNNEYVLQSKNPERMALYVDDFPAGTLFGATIESDVWHDVMGMAPHPLDRFRGMHVLAYRGVETFITIEPVLDFGVDRFLDMLQAASPSFVNIGADSKGHGLFEPSYHKIMQLYERLIESGIEVRKKTNLERLGRYCHKNPGLRQQKEK